MMRFVAGLGLLAGVASASSSCFLLGDIDEPFTAAEVATMRGYFKDNINIEGKGGVVAAPDTNTPGGSYYYHWMRDAALTMRCLQETSTSFSEYEDILKAYTGFVLNAQSLSDPNNIDVRTEPKFTLPNGDVFTGAWCRPQNDGPGLRATALMLFANNLNANNESSYVTENLWTGNPDVKHGGAIKYDLDYVVDNYQSSTCDLWEEFTSDDMFWNRITMKKAMLLGAEFATQMGDKDSASAYTSTANAIDSTLYKNHWDGQAVFEAKGRTYDSAVIVGFNVGYDSSDDLFAPTGAEVAGTVRAYNNLFCEEYAINTADTSAGVPGILYGRYQGDSYAGGNPWVLSTAALANVFYRAASHAKQHGLPDNNALDIWADIFGVSASKITVSTFVAAGDSVMARLHYHVAGNKLHLNEQIDRNTGFEMAANDLTWSYAEVLNAMASRNEYFAV